MPEPGLYTAPEPDRLTLTLCRWREADRAAWLSTAERLLTSTERDRLHALHDPDTRTGHAVGRAILRLAGSALAGVPPTRLRIAASPAGKPMLPQLPLAHVSVAHSERVVAVAVSADTAIGVDVELPRADCAAELRRIAQRRFDASEAAWLTNLDDPQLPEWFTRAWTVKEAVGKALGVGVIPALAGAVVERRGAALALKQVSLPSPIASWALRELVLPDGAERLCLAAAAASPVTNSRPPTQPPRQLTLRDFAHAAHCGSFRAPR